MEKKKPLGKYQLPRGFLEEFGDDLLSHIVTHAVPSALKSWSLFFHGSRWLASQGDVKPAIGFLCRFHKRRGIASHIGSSEAVKGEGNFRVRDGNGWFLFAMATKRQKQKSPQMKNHLGALLKEFGDDLLSHIVTHAVPSALKSLTSVFGMGTGGASSL